MDYNFDYLKNKEWNDKSDKIYVNKKFISNELWENLRKSDLINYHFEEIIKYESLVNYKYVLYEENCETINHLLDILRLNNLLLKVNFEDIKLESFYSEYINEEDYETINIDTYESIELIEKKRKELNN